MEDDDPFASIVHRCKLTSSQEEILRTCPFARESEVFPCDDDESQFSLAAGGIPVESTGIVMVSPPESSREQSPPHEAFQTPPEDSIPASSEEHRPPAAGFDTRSDRKYDVHTPAVDRGCTESERAIDLSKDSDNLGFSGVKPMQVSDSGPREVLGVDGSRKIDTVTTNAASECELEKSKAFHMEWSLVCDEISSGPVRKKLKIFEPPGAPITDTVPLDKETFREEKTSIEVVDLEDDEIGNLGEDKVPDRMPLRETKSGAAVSKDNKVQKNVEDLDKFKYVSTGSLNPSKNISGISGRRELPSTIGEHAKNAGMEVGICTSASKNQTWNDLLGTLEMVAGERGVGSEEVVDFFETAKSRGMSLPWPRWWPTEGCDD